MQEQKINCRYRGQHSNLNIQLEFNKYITIIIVIRYCF